MVFLAHPLLGPLDWQPIVPFGDRGHCRGAAAIQQAFGSTPAP